MTQQAVLTRDLGTFLTGEIIAHWAEKLVTDTACICKCKKVLKEGTVPSALQAVAGTFTASTDTLSDGTSVWRLSLPASGLSGKYMGDIFIETGGALQSVDRFVFTVEDSISV